VRGYFLARLKEPSTWRSAIWVCTSFGLYAFTNDQTSAITALGMALAGGVGMSSPDKLHH
jgi:hypothetical protein